MANSIKFQARFYILNNEVRQLEIWVHRLNDNPLEEQVREHIGFLDIEDVRKAFDLQADKDFNILCSGEVEFWQCNSPDSYGEWDSQLNFDEEFEKEEIEMELAKLLLEEFGIE